MEGVEPVRPGGDAVLGRSSSRLGKLADRMADRKIVARLFTRPSFLLQTRISY
jgi:hypothetical protein